MIPVSLLLIVYGAFTERSLHRPSRYWNGTAVASDHLRPSRNGLWLFFSRDTLQVACRQLDLVSQLIVWSASRSVSWMLCWLIGRDSGMTFRNPSQLCHREQAWERNYRYSSHQLVKRSLYIPSHIRLNVVLALCFQLPWSPWTPHWHNSWWSPNFSMKFVVHWIWCIPAHSRSFTVPDSWDCCLVDPEKNR